MLRLSGSTKRDHRSVARYEQMFYYGAASMTPDSMGVAAWEARIAQAMATPPPVLTLDTPRRRLKGISKAALAICNDDRLYAVKGCQVGRTLVADQVVGRLGAAIGAPVAEVALVDVPEWLIEAPMSALGTSTGSIVHFKPGVGHGSLFIPDCTDSRDLVHEHTDENRDRFAILAVLYGWTGADDRQLLYENRPPHRVHSVDHGFFFGGPDWTIETLTQSSAPVPDPWICASPWVESSRIEVMLARLHDVSDDTIAAAVAAPPEAWGITLVERIALAEYLARRRDALLEKFNGD